MRKVTIVLESKVTTDSPDILQMVADSFPKDDLQIEIHASSFWAGAEKDPNLENSSLDAAKEALEETESTKPTQSEKKSVEEIKKANTQWLKKAAEVGFATLVQTVIKSIIDGTAPPPA